MDTPLRQILKTTNNQTRIDKVYFHSMEAIHEKIEMAFPAFGLFYERTKNQYFDASHERDKIITLPYMIQALIAIVLQRPDQARGRPASYGEKEYDRLFGENDKPILYANVALLMKCVEVFLRSHQQQGTGLERSHQYNIKFYVALYAACSLLKEATPQRSRFESMDLTAATDAMLTKCCEDVDSEYQDLISAGEGDADQVAKGTTLTERIKKNLATRFGNEKRLA